MFFVTIFLLFLSPVLSAAADIYVSSSDGINNTSCWTGGVQTPCATLDLAIQGAATAVQGGGGGIQSKSGTVIYLLPGTYTATVLEQQLISNNVSIISMRNEEVSITVPKWDVNYDDCPLVLNIKFTNLSLQCCPPGGCYYRYYENSSCNCDYLKFTANVIDHCTGEVFDWKNELKVCINDSTSTDPTCTNEIIKPKYDMKYIEQNYGWNICIFDQIYDQIYDQRERNVPELYYELSSFCYDNIIGSDPHTITLSISTIGPTTVSTNITVNITSECRESYNTVNGTCELYPMCSLTQEYCPYAVHCNNYCDYYDKFCLDSTLDNTCRSNGSLCASCPFGDGVPINKIKKCVSCCHYLSDILVFIGIEILPMTIIVLLIIALNIQLTNGSINGLVFFPQIIFVVYSDYVLLTSSETDYQINDLFASPNSVFNLDFTPFLGNYSLCIVPHMSPLGAISFWYVIGFYPLLLLLLLYVWITLYDKGYKCVALVTRPFHRCMARFWSMTGIEPSFTHSIASIYILCFTQLAATSFKILRFCFSDSGSLLFFYDKKQPYFGAIHVLASIFAILVLLVFILLPTLYILFYRFKCFHKLLDCFRLRKQLLISLGDVFTGPYKNGSDGTYDNRFFAGFYLLLRILIINLQFGLFLSLFESFFIPSTIQCCLVSLLALTVFIFRPFKRNVHNFCEVLVLAFVIALFILYIFTSNSFDEDDDYYLTSGMVIMSFNIILYSILPMYTMYQFCKIMINCYNYHKLHNHTIRIQEREDQPLVGNDDDWIADRMKNPQEYDEQHVPFRLDDLSVEYPQDNTVAANYGSINSNKTVHTKNS